MDNSQKQVTLQNIIKRMAHNSQFMKKTALAFTLIFLFLLTKWNFSYIMLLPVGVCFLLDAYYLGLERHFIALSRLDDSIRAPKNFQANLVNTVNALFSVSTIPFYTMVGTVLYWFGV